LASFAIFAVVAIRSFPCWLPATDFRLPALCLPEA
jgi:hypothetical protein